MRVHYGLKGALDERSYQGFYGNETPFFSIKPKTAIEGIISGIIHPDIRKVPFSSRMKADFKNR
jgi:hypothetical protein